jgi:hypothetical protein
MEANEVVFITTVNTIQPYIVAAVTLPCDPGEWQRAPREKAPLYYDPEEKGFDNYRRWGRMFFLYYRDYEHGQPFPWPELVPREEDSGRREDTWFILRPPERQMLNTVLRHQLGDPVREIRGPDGQLLLQVFKADLRSRPLYRPPLSLP